MKLYAQKGSDTAQVLLTKIRPSINFRKENDVALEYLLIKFDYYFKVRDKQTAWQALEEAKIHYEHSTDEYLRLAYELASFYRNIRQLPEHASEARLFLKKTTAGNFPEYIVEANILLFRLYKKRLVKDSVDYYLDEAWCAAKEYELPIKEALVLSTKGTLQLQLANNYKKVIDLFERSSQLYAAHGFEINVARNLIYEADIYRSRDLFEEAYILYQKALGVFEKYKVDYEVGIINRYMGLIYQDVDSDEEAIEQFKLAKGVLADSLYPYTVSRLNTDLANSYLALGNYAEAENNFKKSIALKEEINDNYTLAYSYSSLGNLYLKEKRLEDAIAQFEKAVELSKLLESKRSLAESYLGLSQLYIEKNDLKLAGKNGELALKYAEEKEAIETKFSTMLVLAKIASKNADYALSNQYYQKSINLQDSVINFKEALKVTNIITDINVNKKELEILNLMYENDRKAAELEQNTLQSRLYSMGFVAAVITFLLFLGSFLQNRKARKKQKELDDSLNENNGKLSESNEQLGLFAHQASHDPKSPLTSINLFSSLLETTNQIQIEEKEKHFIHLIAESDKSLVDIIDDMLEFSKIGLRRITLKLTDMNTMVEDILNLLTADAEKYNIALGQLNAFPNAMVDDIKLKCVFLNIISNAIKFYDVNKADRYILLDYKALNNFHQFSITDNGIGIPKTAKKIFKPLALLNTDNNYRGTGLGLAVCEKIIAKHGGNIWHESDLGKGTTFYFTIERQKCLDSTPSHKKNCVMISPT